MTASFQPFADESAVVSVDNLTVENRIDRVIISGATEITLDKVGLAKAEAILALLQPVLSHLRAQADLPETVITTTPSKVPNPFGRKAD